MKMRACFAIVLLLGLVIVPVHADVEPVQFLVHGSLDQMSLYESIFEQFTAETGIPVELIHSPGSQRTKWERVLVNVAGGLSPDVIGGVSTEFGEFALSGLLRPLDDLIERDGLAIDQLVPPFVDALRLEGSQYILPYGSSVLAMMYNQDHMDMAGVAPPPTQWDTAEWTYDEFVDKAKRLTIASDSGSPERYGIIGPYWDSWITLPIAWGGQWASADLRTFLGVEQPAIDSLQSLQHLMHEEQVMMQTTNTSNTNRFLNEEGSMGALGTWTLPTLAERTELNWSFMPWFTVNDQSSGPIFPIGFGILNTSSNVENAWELIKYLVWNEKANLQYALAAGALPSLISNLSEWQEDIEATFGSQINAGIAINQAATNGGIVHIRKSPAFWTIDEIMHATARSVINNQKPAETAIGEVADMIHMLLEETAP